MELTEREIAIAGGLDPDAPVIEAEQVEVTEDLATEESQVVSEGTEATATVEPEQPETDVQKSWITDDVRELGKGFGLDDSKLETFGSEAEFRKAVMLADQALIAKPAEKKVEATATQVAEDVELDLEKLKEAGYDEESLKIAKVAKSARDELKAAREEIAALREQSNKVQEHFTKETQRREAEAFHSLVDTLDENLFGRASKDGKLTSLEQKFDDNRRKLHEAATTLVNGIVRQAESQGRQPVLPDTRVILQRARMLAFGDEIAKSEREAARKQVLAEVEKQSKTRRPVASSRQSRTPAGQFAPKETDVVADIMNDPDVKKFLAETQ